MISDVVAVRILGLDRSTFEKQQSEAAEDEVKSNKISKKKFGISKNFKKRIEIYSISIQRVIGPTGLYFGDALCRKYLQVDSVQVLLEHQKISRWAQSLSLRPLSSYGDSENGENGAFQEFRT